MNYHHADPQDLADIFRKSTILTSSPAGAITITVAEYAGNDVLIITDVRTGIGTIIESDDSNYGGSVHDHVRCAMATGTMHKPTERARAGMIRAVSSAMRTT